MGWRCAGSRRYSRRRPSARQLTSPTSLRTRRCFETWGWDIDRSLTIAPTGFSPVISASRISRRCASATALKTSDVVEALATLHYIPVSEYVEPAATGANPSAARSPPELVRLLGHLAAGLFQVRGPRQHALEGRLTAAGQLADHRDVALDTPDDRVAYRGPVAGVSVRV